MASRLPTTALYRRIGRPSRLPTIRLHRTSDLQRLLALFGG